MCKNKILLSMLVVVVMLSSCKSKPKANICEYKIKNNLVDAVDIDVLKKTLTLCKNVDGGYGYLAESNNNIIDYYDTYYAISSLEIINEELEIVLDGQGYKFDQITDLSDLYFYIQLLKNDLSESFKEECKSFVLDLETSVGTFAYNKEQLIDLGDNKDRINELYLSTFYAISILNSIDCLDYNIENIKEWVQSRMDMIIANDEFSFSTIANVRILYMISNCINDNFNCKIEKIYSKKIINKLTKVNEIVSTKISKKNISLIDLSNYLELMDLVKASIVDTEELLNKYILQHQNVDGGFGIVLNAESNSGITFLAIKMLNRMNGLNYSAEEKVLSYFNRYRLNNGYYTTMHPIDSDIVSTYYIYQIYKLLGINTNINIMSYLNHLDDSYQMHPYFWRLKIESGINITEEEEKIILDTVKDKIDSYNNDYNSSIALYNFLIILNDLNIKLDKNNKNKLRGLLSRDNKNDIAVQSYNKLMFSILGSKVEPINNKELKKIINENDELYGLFHSLYTEYYLNDTNIELDKNIIYQVLKDTYCDNGMFAYSSQKDNVDIRSVYYGLWVMKNVLSITWDKME